MKKIFTLIAGLFITAAVFAAAPRPTVTVTSNKNFRIVIDGRSYFGSNASIKLANLGTGQHTIKVYEMRTGMFSRTEKLVSSSSFSLGRNDVQIKVDNFGRIAVIKAKGKGKKPGNSFRKTNRMQKQPQRRF